jgi:ubiquinone/menaquinone biosynthesis C-methylase UbiE
VLAPQHDNRPVPLSPVAQFARTIVTLSAMTAVRSADDGHPDDGSSLDKIKRRYADNGLAWTAFHVLSRGAGRVSLWFEERARVIERDRGVPGINSVARNRDVWGGYDWTGGGEEWTMSEPWRQGVVDSFMTPYLDTRAAGRHVLEIGPGAGRWTELLAPRAAELYLLDITDTTLELCRKRLGDPPNTHYLVGDGASLPGVPDAGIDFLWSFDVFVHIAPAEQQKYAAEFRRVLKPGGIAVIHHGDSGLQGGWRSAMTAELFRETMTANGLRVVDQVRSWGPAGEFRPSVEGDVVTVLEA